MIPHLAASAHSNPGPDELGGKGSRRNRLMPRFDPIKRRELAASLRKFSWRPHRRQI
jgi:hypothetical protein